MKKSKILYTASTAQHLQRFHVPYIEALRSENQVLTMATGDGVDYSIVFDKHYFSLTNLRSLRRIRRILREEQFDLIVLNTTLTAFWVRAALWGMKNRPYVINVVHGYLFPFHGGGIKKQVLLFCERLMRSKTDDIAVMNAEDLQTAQKYKLCRGKIYFLYGMGLSDGYTKRAIDSTVRQRYASEEELLCIFVGELSSRKNQRFLIQGIKALREDGIPAKLLLVGEGGEYDALRSLIAQNGLEDSVLTVGHSDDVPSLLAASDLYVSASISEGLPFNLMEAMAYGLPIVASDVRGQVDLLRERPESLYPLNDTEAFCQKVKAFYQQKKLGRDAIVYSEIERYYLRSVMDDNIRILSIGLNKE